MLDQQTKNKIDRLFAEGKTPQDIENYFLSQGLDNEQIKTIIDDYNGWNKTPKNKLIKIVSFILIICFIVAGLLSYFIFKNKIVETDTAMENNGDDLPFLQSFNSNDFIPYKAPKYYSLNYPKDWSVYQKKGQDTEVDSLLIVPKDVGEKYIDTPTTEVIISTYGITRDIQNNAGQFIEITAGFLYSEPISDSKQADYIDQIISSQKENDSKSLFKRVSFNNTPAVYSVYIPTDHSADSRYITSVSYDVAKNIRTESLSWFAKPDPKRRGGNDTYAPVLINITYAAPVEDFSEQIFSGVVASINESFWQDFNNELEKAKIVNSGNNDFQQNTEYGAQLQESENFARAKGDNALAKSKLAMMRADAELYFDKNSNSYAGVCNSDQFRQGIESANEATGYKVICLDTQLSWAAEVKLKLNDGYFCVDYFGEAITNSEPRIGAFVSCK